MNNEWQLIRNKLPENQSPVQHYEIKFPVKTCKRPRPLTSEGHWRRRHVKYRLYWVVRQPSWTVVDWLVRRSYQWNLPVHSKSPDAVTTHHVKTSLLAIHWLPAVGRLFFVTLRSLCGNVSVNSYKNSASKFDIVLISAGASLNEPSPRTADIFINFLTSFFSRRRAVSSLISYDLF